MPRSEQINELAASLAVAQGAMSVAIKDSTNPHFRSKYADLASVIDAVRPHLSANGICFVQEPTTEAGMVVVETTLYHKSGQWISSKLSVACKDLSPQPVGSATTYARRYALMAICGIAPAEDDDGESAQGRPQPQRPAPKAPAPPPADPVQPTTLPEQFDGVGQVKEVRALVTAIKERVHVDRLKDLTALIQAYCAPTRDAQGKITAYFGTVPADPATYKTLCTKLADFK
jgi:hypothetical protein